MSGMNESMTVLAHDSSARGRPRVRDVDFDAAAGSRSTADWRRGQLSIPLTSKICA